MTDGLNLIKGTPRWWTEDPNQPDKSIPFHSCSPLLRSVDQGKFLPGLPSWCLHASPPSGSNGPVRGAHSLPGRVTKRGEGDANGSKASVAPHLTGDQLLHREHTAPAAAAAAAQCASLPLLSAIHSRLRKTPNMSLCQNSK